MAGLRAPMNVAGHATAEHAQRAGQTAARCTRGGFARLEPDVGQPPLGHADTSNTRCVSGNSASDSAIRPV